MFVKNNTKVFLWIVALLLMSLPLLLLEEFHFWFSCAAPTCSCLSEDKKKSKIKPVLLNICCFQTSKLSKHDLNFFCILFAKWGLINWNVQTKWKFCFKTSMCLVSWTLYKSHKYATHPLLIHVTKTDDMILSTSLV